MTDISAKECQANEGTELVFNLPSILSRFQFSLIVFYQRKQYSFHSPLQKKANYCICQYMKLLNCTTVFSPMTF